MSTFGSRFGIWENVSGYSYWGSCCVFILIVYLQLLLHFQFKLLTFLSQFHTLPTDRTAVGCLKPVWETNQAQCTNVKYTPATPSSFNSTVTSHITHNSYCCCCSGEFHNNRHICHLGHVWLCRCYTKKPEIQIPHISLTQNSCQTSHLLMSGIQRHQRWLEHRGYFTRFWKRQYLAMTNMWM